MKIYLSMFACSILLASQLYSQDNKEASRVTMLEDLSANYTAKTAGEDLARPSVFYDAIEIYYIIQGYSVYPELLEDAAVEPDTLPTGTGANPGLGLNIRNRDAMTFTGVQSLHGPQGDGAFASLDEPGYPDNHVVTGRFRLRECVTQKIVADDVTGNLAEILEPYLVKPDVRQALLNRILLNYPGVSLDNPAFTPGVLSSATLDATFSLEGGANLTTMVLQGMTDWAIEAVNREIQEAVFIKLKNALQRIPEMGILFPQSLETLAGIEITNYNNSLTAFKRSFSEDMSNLAGNFTALSTLPKYAAILQKYPLTCLLFMGADLFQKLKSGNESPAEMIHGIGSSTYLAATGDGTTRSLIRLSVIMSDAFRDLRTSDGLELRKKSGWLRKEKLTILTDNPAVYAIFIQLLNSRMSGITLFSQPVSGLLDNGNTLAGAAVNIIRRSLEFQRSIIAIRAMDSTTSFQDRAQEYVNVCGKFLDFAMVAFDLMPTNQTVLDMRDLVDGIKEKGLPLLQASADVAVRVRSKDYSGAVYAVDTMVSILRRAIDPGATDSMTRLHSNLLHYGLFIANVAEAKTAGDVKSAINSIALPKGSSRIKKESDFSWGINAYAGFTSAWNKQYPDVNLRRRENTVFVPFGFNFNKGHFLSGSLSLHAGLLDLGAIFTYRVNNSTNDLESDIRLEQVFSPSVSLVYGLPIIRQYNVPLSIGAGWQWGPRLRKVDDQNGNSVLPFMTRRFQVFAAVDLPVINFHVSRSEKQRKRN
ncbi:MAG: hypothetical protein EOO05_02390 [Chitinophagaceae bacterium]|nr:MAG: hypothetical protein EOO05_02390 [Chitinophagaceae bacterium]